MRIRLIVLIIPIRFTYRSSQLREYPTIPGGYFIKPVVSSGIYPAVPAFSPQRISSFKQHLINNFIKCCESYRSQTPCCSDKINGGLSISKVAALSALSKCFRVNQNQLFISQIWD